MRAGRRHWARAGGIGSGLAIATFALYFLAYPVRGIGLPPGFDAAWYVWRARFTAARGLGPLGSGARPGHALLSSVLGSITGLSQLQMIVVLSLVLIATLALAVGGFSWGAFGPDRLRWALAIAIAGAILGATRLLGENMANLLNLALIVAALIPLSAAVSGEKGMVGAIALLVASGVAHWDFLAVFGAVLAVCALMALPASLRAREEGVPLARTEAGVLVTVGAWLTGLMAVLIGGILRAPFKTGELVQNPNWLDSKLRTDLARLVVPEAAAAASPFLLPRLSTTEGRTRRAFALRILSAWVIVMAAGMAFGLLFQSYPPHRFLTLAVALPGVLLLALLACILVRRLMTRSFALACIVAVLAIAALATPSVLRWYRYPVLLRSDVLEEAESADRYMAGLTPGSPVVFLFTPPAGAGPYQGPLAERSIRAELAPARQTDAHFYMGELSNLLAGRRTVLSDSLADRVDESYWEDVQPVLASNPPVILLQALNQDAYRGAMAAGAAVVGPGLAVLRGPAAEPAVPAGNVPKAAPPFALGLLWGAFLMGLLVLAGAGWTRAMLGTGASPELFVSIAPAVGAAAIILCGLVATEIGVRPGGAGGVAVYAAAAAAGFIAARLKAGRASMPPSARDLPRGARQETT